MTHATSPDPTLQRRPAVQAAAAAAASSGVAARPTTEPAPSADPQALIRAVTLQGEGRKDEAEALFREYLTKVPLDPVAVYSLCVILMQRGDHREAIGWLDQGTQRHPGFAPLWVARGSVLQSLDRRDDALAAYNQALALKPDYIEALINSGAILREMHQHAPALERFNQALAINPNHENALGNCAILLTEFKRSEQAIAMFARLLQINPNYDYGRGLLSYERLHICDWTDFEPTRQTIVEEVRQGRRSCKSLGFMAISDNAADHQTCARTFAKRFPTSPQPLWNGERYRHRRIRIAYVSPDLREHPVGHLMAGIFERHDKQRFETIAISLGVDDNSRLRQRMLGAFEHFIDARHMTARAIAERMREMEVDIAIDLAGYTSDSRTEIFAHRPAPIQVNYLGYPGTMGVDYMDYILADRHVIPAEHQQHYDEKVVYLPDAYLPTDAGLQIADATPSRADCGLPDDAIVFCSFSHDYKISPPVFDSWMRILARVPGSVLWLVSRNEAAQRNLRREAEARGIEGSRLVFASRVPRVEDHLARYRQADLFLDTHPYNAHTTCADALMAGLPVITCMGQSFPSRVAGSLLHAVGLQELVTDSFSAYEDLAVALALSPERVAAVKARLAVNSKTHPLFDTDLFCANLESVYHAMWRQYQLGDARDALSAA